MLGWLKHAFAVSSVDDVVPTAAQTKLIDRVCHETVRRQMTLPAIMLLESSAPLNFLAGQSLRFFEPILGTILDSGEIRDFAEFIEHRGAIEFICRRLTELEESEPSILSDHPRAEK